MRSLAVALSILVLGSNYILQNAEASPVTISAAESERNEKVVLKQLWPVLQIAGEAGRIYYRAPHCEPANVYPAAFPQIDISAPPKSGTGLAAVRKIFESDKSITVAEDRPGIISIRIGDVPDTVLQTRIPVMELNPQAQYDRGAAIGAILAANEVRAAIRALGIHMPLQITRADMLVVRPAEGLIHLPASITNVTMDQALDVVAKTFKGIILYGACVQPPFFAISFKGGIGFDDRSLDSPNGQ